MIWLYRLLFLPALIVALPYYLLRMWKRGGYRKDFQHRFGRFKRLSPSAPGKTRIWLQAVSVGEILAIGPLIDALCRSGSVEIVLTTTTSTGYAEARKRYADRVLSIGIFPLDFWLFSRTAWQRIQPDALILTEGELWPEHLHRARAAGIPTFLVNARMSDRSFRRYQKTSKLAARLLGKLDRIYAASELDRERLTRLGVAPEAISAPGSIKFDVALPPLLSPETRETLRNELGFQTENASSPFVLLGSSTWPGEEVALLNAQQRLIKNGIDCRLLLVPRHAERGAELVRLLENQPLSWHRRSSGKIPAAPVRIHLADTTGELTHLTQAADLAFIGKSLPPHHAGQTPIEAAGLGLPILIGPNMSNFKDVSNSLLRHGVARRIATPEELGVACLESANAPEIRQKMGRAGLEWHQKNRGSSQRVADGILKALLDMK